MASKKLTGSIKYSVVGRYMNGKEVIAYHLVGDDNSQLKLSKEQLIYYVGKGIIYNCRVQQNNGKPLLRGKNINLYSLPIYDEKTGNVKVTHNASSEKKIENNRLGLLSIVGRKMDKTTCVGYIVTDASGKEREVSRDEILQLAEKKLISNATIQHYQGKVILRGVGVDIASLPYIQISKPQNSGLSNEEKLVINALRICTVNGVLDSKRCNLMDVLAESKLTPDKFDNAVMGLKDKGLVEVKRLHDGINGRYIIELTDNCYKILNRRSI